MKRMIRQYSMFESQVSLQDRLMVGRRKFHRTIRRFVVLLFMLLTALFFFNTQHAWAQPGVVEPVHGKQAVLKFNRL